MVKKNSVAPAKAGASHTDVDNVASYSLIELADIVEGPNVRRTYDKVELSNLAKSIAEDGLAQPILVTPRKLADGNYLLVAGFRRKRAFELNNAKSIPAFVRELTDDEINNLRGVENLQRVDLPPLDEAQYYSDMLANGKTAADAARIGGRSVGHVKKRLGLLSLNVDVKNALTSGAITTGHAELIGRIPNVNLQAEALGAMFDKPRDGQVWDEATEKWVKAAPRLLSLPEAARVIERRFMLDVSKAPFDPKDTELSSLGACTTCEFLTGNSLDLFGDVANKSFCTNPTDYERKISNWLKRRAEAGAIVLEEKDMKKVWPHYPSNQHYIANDWENLDNERFLGGKHRKPLSVVKGDQTKDIVYAWAFGRLWQLMSRQKFDAVLLANGYADAVRSSREPGAPRTKTKEEIDRDYRDRMEKAVQKEVSTAMVAVLQTKTAAKFKFDDFVDIFARVVVLDKGWLIDDVLPRHLPAGRTKMNEQLLKEWTTQQKVAFILDAMTDRWNTSNAGQEKQRMYMNTARFLGVNVDEIKKALAEEFKLKRMQRAERDAKGAAKKAAKTRKTNKEKSEVIAKPKTTAKAKPKKTTKAAAPEAARRSRKTTSHAAAEA